MKKVKEIKGYKHLYMYRNSIIVQDENSIQQINANLESKPLVKGKIYTVNVLNDSLFYQLNDSSNIHVLDREDLNEPHLGVWGILSAMEYKDYIYVYSNFENEDAYYLLDKNLNVFYKINHRCNFSYAMNLFRTGLNNAICYEMNEKQWHYKRSDDSIIRIISGYKDKILLYSESGDYFALNLQNGNVSWKYPEKSYRPNSLYEDSLYTCDQNNLIEIDAETGEKTRIIDINTIEMKEKFSINRIKAYDDYIFCTDTFGTIAVMNRKTLTIKDILRFENHLINWDYSLQWINNRLYVQDVEKVIHIFEEEK